MSWFNDNDEPVYFSSLIGKTIVKITGLEKYSDGVTFECSDGTKYKMYHQQASVQKIESIIAIEGADRICQYFVNGWKVIDQVGKYKVGDLVIFCEIDSWIPNSIAPFLSKGKTPREYNGVPGERLKTIKMKGALSQGIILQVSDETIGFEIDKDVSDHLGIVKWEPDDKFSSGNTKGSFPAFIRKTDQDRVQNIYRSIENLQITSGDYFVIEEKAEGSSITCYLKFNEETNQYDFGVCSRNLELKDDGNTYFETAKKLDVEAKMRQILSVMNSAKSAGVFILQGELVGPGIQGNIYDLTEHTILFFDASGQEMEANLNNSNAIEFCDPETFHKIAKDYDLPTVPVIGKISTIDLKMKSLDDILNFANATTCIGSKKHLREGVVFKLQDDRVGVAKRFTFKAISNEYLLKRGY